MSKPEAGQWWFKGEWRRFIVGRAGRGLVVEAGVPGEYRLGYVTDLTDWSGWYHEPRCTGWNWVVSEQPQPAEDPDEWVIQDRVPIRDGIDQGRYQMIGTQPVEGDRWFKLSGMNAHTRGLMHGSEHRFDPNCTLHVRCRRRDLPKVEQKKTTDDFGMYLESIIAKDPQLKAEVDAAEAELAAIDARLNEPQPQKTRVRLWMRNELKGRPSLFACDERPYPDSHKYVEIHHDSEGFYVEGEQL